MLGMLFRSEMMRSLMLACLAIALCSGPGSGTPAFAQAHRRARFHPPTRCPELRMDGFCYYDSGWHPAADNPLFSPLRPGDPQARSGPLCDLTDSRSRILASFETENEDVPPALRIGGRLVRFHRAGDGDSNHFVSAQGHLRLREGAVVARDHESDAVRGTLTFTDLHGRAHVASVRVNCGL